MYDEPGEKNFTSDFLDNLYSIDNDALGGCASAHDCTGLIPSGMASEAQLQSYKDLYAFPTAPVVAKKETYFVE